MPDITRTWEKFHEAVRALVLGEGALRERLVYAHLYNLDHLQTDAIPLDMRDDFLALKARVRRVAPTGGEGPIAATVNTMDDIEVTRAADEIISLYDKVARIMGKRE